MTIHTKNGFDPETFKRAYETWDLPALLAYYAEDVELTMITAENPPGSPLVHRGKQAVQQIVEHGRAAGVAVTVERLVVGEAGAAATFHCRFPGGQAVVANAIFDLVDGRIVREHEVLAGGIANEVIARS